MGIVLKGMPMMSVLLSLEPFHNAGLTPEETRWVIESTVRPQRFGFSSNDTYTVKKSGINNNWTITNMVHTNIYKVDKELSRIEDALNDYLSRKRVKELLRQ